MVKFTFGSDPEFFLEQKEEFKSAIGVLPPKESPKKINGHSFYFDNVLAEIAIKPADNRCEAIENIRESLKLLNDLISPNKFIIKASTNFPSFELTSKQARIAGCNAEWSVYTLKVIDPPARLIDCEDGYFYFKVPFRTAGGHIHLGADLLDDVFQMFNVLRMMDLFIGIPSVFMDTDPSSKSRRKAYGLAGSHRRPEEGSRVEYRPLSNFWFSSPEYAELIYDLSDFVLNFVAENGYKKFWEIDESLLERKDPSIAHICTGYDVKALQKSINTCDETQAAKFMMIVENYLPTDLFKKITKLSGKELPDPYKEWGI
jgi:hypothetical protein